MATAKKKLLITGASGYLGQHFLSSIFSNDNESIQKNYEMFAIYHRSSAFEAAVQSAGLSCHVHSLDLTDAVAVDDYLQKYGPFDICFHLAALSSPAVCESNPDLAKSLNVPIHFLQSLLHLKCFLVVTSTDQVYEGNKGSPYVEEDSPHPVNTYGRTKLELEHWIVANYQDAIILRSSILLGPRAPLSSDAHDTFLHFCYSRREDPTTFFTDERRSVLAVMDAFRVFEYVLMSSICGGSLGRIPPGTYNMGGPDSISRYDMALAVQTFIQSSADTILQVTKGQSGGGVPSPLDITMTSQKLYSVTGFKFKSLQEIVPLTFHQEKP
jgi:dTDP-4-dehydrorhamnose reductase